MTAAPTVGVLALQGDVREHLAALRSLGADPIPVRRPGELAACDGLVIPGGESTTMVKLATIFDLLEPLRDAVRDGLPAFGTCAGMIMLDRDHLGILDIRAERNAFGRQVRSFEADLDLFGRPLHAIFIRAPWVAEAGEDVEVLASVDGHPVAVRQGNLLAVSFHPELGEDVRLHERFLESVDHAR